MYVCVCVCVCVCVRVCVCAYECVFIPSQRFTESLGANCLSGFAILRSFDNYGLSLDLFPVHIYYPKFLSKVVNLF